MSWFKKKVVLTEEEEKVINLKRKIAALEAEAFSLQEEREDMLVRLAAKQLELEKVKGIIGAI